MSLYNLMCGVNPAAFFILPMLGKHAEEYPRFRDCFVEDGKIQVYTRIGGGNRENYQEAIMELRNIDGYIEDFDDDFDSTYATFVFDVPDRWKNDFALVLGGKLKSISEEYKKELYRVYPKLKEKFDEIFSGKDVK